MSGSGPLRLGSSPDSTATVCWQFGGTCSKGATDPCKIGVMGSIPIVSTHEVAARSTPAVESRLAHREVERTGDCFMSKREVGRGRS